MSDIRMPEAGFSVTEGTVLQWHKRVGDPVESGENLVSVETDKITVDIPAESSGVLREILFQPGDTVPTGAVMGRIGEPGAPAGQAPHPAPEEGAASPAAPGGIAGGEPEARRVFRSISPAAKAVARERGVDLGRIAAGTGPGGRIVRQDVLDYLDGAAGEAAPFAEAELLPAPSAAPLSSAPAAGQRVEFKGWRKVIADRMLESVQRIPHYTMSVEADVTGLSRLIGGLRERRPERRAGYLPFMMKAIGIGLREAPYINAFADSNGFTVQERLNIGIAVDLGEKLLVPVVRDVQDKSIWTLFAELQELVGRARADRLEAKDVEGGTITLTNVGMFGTIAATSIILPPQVAIVYMGAAREVPAVWEGRIEARTRMVFGATFDHRVVNGAAGGRFLKRVKQCLEDGNELLLHLR